MARLWPHDSESNSSFNGFEKIEIPSWWRISVCCWQVQWFLWIEQTNLAMLGERTWNPVWHESHKIRQGFIGLSLSIKEMWGFPNFAKNPPGPCLYDKKNDFQRKISTSVFAWWYKKGCNAEADSLWNWNDKMLPWTDRIWMNLDGLTSIAPGPPVDSSIKLSDTFWLRKCLFWAVTGLKHFEAHQTYIYQTNFRFWYQKCAQPAYTQKIKKVNNLGIWSCRAGRQMQHPNRSAAVWLVPVTP